MERPAGTLTFGEQPGGLTARDGWTWEGTEDRGADKGNAEAAEDSSDGGPRQP